MGLIDWIGTHVDSLIDDTRKLIERARRGELPAKPCDPQEVLGDCVHCQAPVRRMDGLRLGSDYVTHGTCEIAHGRDRARMLDGYEAYLAVARRLLLLGDPRVSATVRDVGTEIPKPALRADLIRGLEEVARRVAGDAIIPPDVKAQVAFMIEDGRTALRGELVAGN